MTSHVNNTELSVGLYNLQHGFQLTAQQYSHSPVCIVYVCVCVWKGEVCSGVAASGASNQPLRTDTNWLEQERQNSSAYN